MSDDWTLRTASELCGRHGTATGIWLILGSTDTGKTTFVTELARRLTTEGRCVAIVDADVGQSHVGQAANNLAVLKAPPIQISSIACLVIGSAAIENL